MPRVNPYRPDNRVTQSFNSGYAVVYTVTDVARPGYAPVEALKRKIRVDYEERRVGVARFYEAAQNQIRIDRLIRTPRVEAVSTQDVIVLNGDGVQYRIDQVQTVDGIFPPSMDLTLTRIEQTYSYAEEGGDGE